MINKIIAFLFGLVASSYALSQPACSLGTPTLLQYSFYNLSPYAAAAGAANPNVVSSVTNAANAWNSSNASDRFIFFWNIVNANDCPHNQYRQIGAFNFETTNCATTNSLNHEITAGYTDGQKSVSINLMFVWHAGSTPALGELHLASTLAHEFGHALGLGHMANGACTPAPLECGSSPNLETMSSTGYEGQTCRATIEANDISSANALYP